MDFKESKIEEGGKMPVNKETLKKFTLKKVGPNDETWGIFAGDVLLHTETMPKHRMIEYANAYISSWPNSFLDVLS